MKLAPTYHLEVGQYSPNQKREDGQGYEARYIYAETFEEGAQKAKEMFADAPPSPFGPMVCKQIMLFDFENEEEDFTVAGFMDRMAIFDYETLEREVAPVLPPLF